MILLRKALLFSCLLKCISTVSSAATGDLLTTFNFSVNDMVADPTRPLIYASVPSTNSIAVFNSDTLSLVATIPVGSNPMGLVLSPDGSRLYVANSGSTASAIGVVDLNTLQTLPSISAPSSPYYLAVGSGRLYASSGNGIMQFDLGTGTYTSSFSGYPYGDSRLSTSLDGKTLFQATEGVSPASLFKYNISTATAALQQTINTSEGGSAFPIVTPDGLGVIMANGYALQERSTSDINTVLGTFNVGAYTGPAALTSDGQWLLTTNYDSLELWNANTFVEKTSFSIPSYPTKDIELDNSGRLIFVGENNQIQVFSSGVNDNTVTLNSGALAITQANSTDLISTTTSGSVLRISPANSHATADFSGVSTINVTFTGDNETATFDSTKFSFTPKVTINGGTSTDKVVIQGSHVVTFTGTGTYGGGTKIQSGVLAFNNGAALGTGAVTLSTGAELRGIGTVTLNNTVNFAGGTTNAVISAAAGGLVTLNNLDATNTNTLTFGSVGNTGTVTLGSGVTLGANITGVTVAFGTLADGGGFSQLVSPSQVTTTVNAGAKLALQDISTTINSLKGSGAVTLGVKATTALTLNAATFGGIISGAGSVTTGNPLIFTGANTYTGGTTIAAGESITLGQGGTTGSIVGSVSVASGGSLIFDRGNAYSFAGVISGAGGVTQEGAGVLTLTGTNTYTGGTNITAGVLAFSKNSVFGSGPVVLSSGAELRGSGVVTLGNTVSFAIGTTRATISAAAGATITLNNLDATNTGAITFGSTGTTGTIALASGITPVPAGTTATVAFGTLRNAGGLTALTGHAQQTNVNAGATLALNDLNAEIASLGGTGAVKLGAKATTVLTLDAANFGGVISGAGSVQASNADFTGANTYTGGTSITAGQSLTLGAGGTTGSIMGNVSVGSGGLLAFNRSNAYSFAGKISGVGGVKQEGAGVLTLTGNNTYAGGTQVTAGVLVFNNANALGTGAVTLSTATELRGGATGALNDTVNFAAGTTQATLSAKAGITETFNNLDTSNTPGVTFGSVGNTGTVVIGSNVTDFNGTAFTVAYGTLKNGGGLGTLTGNAPTVTINKGATLAANDFNLSIGNLQGGGVLSLGVKATTTLSLGGGNFSGVISGSGKLTLDGAVTLSGASTYTGGTTLVAGTTLVKNTTGSATGTGPVTIQTGATLGGNGTLAGALTLQSGGTIAPGIALPGTAGTKLHGKSLLWDGGSTLTFQLGATTADELLLTGALTKGAAGTFTIDIDDAGLAAGSYTLMTFASTTFLQSDFTLVLPGTATGTLIEKSTSLVLNITHTTLPALGQEMVAPTTKADSGFNDSATSITMTPTPEPGSALLLAFGGTALLGYRRQRRSRAK
ncbi:MAG: beta strand repeat-containing protein [Chthoniobacter sp.]